MARKVNGFTIETIGGFITVKHWAVSNEAGKFMGIFFKFREARQACLNNDFSSAYMHPLY